MMNLRQAYKEDDGLKKQVLHAEGIPLSGKAMEAYAPKGTHVFLESELKGKDRQWMVGSAGCYIMLYQFPGRDVGHWICGWSMPDGSVKHFDPYGKAPNFYTPQKPYLKVLEEGKYTYDHRDYQRLNKSIETCGRHCLVRLQFKDHSDSEYAGLIDRNGNADEEVTLMTLNDSMKN